MAKVFIFYFRSVRMRKKTVAETRLLFLKDLGEIYQEREIHAILHKLFNHSAGWNRAAIHLNKDTILDNETLTFFTDTLRRLKQGEPVQYIIGITDFCGLTLTVGPGVLIPRPETEELAQIVISENKELSDLPASVLDLGTGSGCLALAIKQAFPFASVTGLDLFPSVLEYARRNAIANGLFVTFIEGDILSPGQLDLCGLYDIILSNPPYIPMHERDQMSRQVFEYEPSAALFVPNDQPLIFNEAIASIALERLVDGGRLYLEIHEGMGRAISILLEQAGMSTVEIIQDLSGKDRFVRASAPNKGRSQRSGFN